MRINKLYLKKNITIYDALLKETESFGLKVENTDDPKTIEDRLILYYNEDGLSLREKNLSYRGDFSKLLKRTGPGYIERELLIKACGKKALKRAVDMTAGLGEDSFLLAAFGISVKMLEKDPYVYLLLFDSLQRAKDNPDTEKIAERMEIFFTDSKDYLRENIESFDSDTVIYLDPMFPERKKSGLIKKKFQLLQLLESPCQDGQELLDAAMSVKHERIIIKRPGKSEPLSGRRPSFSIKGTTIRYDVIKD